MYIEYTYIRVSVCVHVRYNSYKYSKYTDRNYCDKNILLNSVYEQMETIWIFRAFLIKLEKA